MPCIVFERSREVNLSVPVNALIVSFAI